VTLVDTAGLREATDPIEAEGVARTRQAQGVAALTIVVIDQSAPLDPAARRLVADRGSAAFVVLNKCDRQAAWPAGDLVDVDPVIISAATGKGLDALRARVARELSGRDDWRDPPAISNARHLALVDDARTALGSAGDAIEAGASEELVLTSIGDARQALEAITGRRAPDDLLRHIFSRFCIGK